VPTFSHSHRTGSRRVFLRAAGAALGLGVFGVRSARAAQGLVLITGANSGVTNVSRGELKRLFLGDQVMLAGQNLTAFNLPPSSAERQLFERRVLDMTSGQAAKYWIDRRIRGQSGAPKIAPSPQVLLKIAANFAGAIGYLPADLLVPSVKALAIDGVPSGDGRYLLRGP
jgi:hypothetical protein